MTTSRDPIEAPRNLAAERHLLILQEWCDDGLITPGTLIAARDGFNEALAAARDEGRQEAVRLREAATALLVELEYWSYFSGPVRKWRFDEVQPSLESRMVDLRAIVGTDRPTNWPSHEPYPRQPTVARHGRSSDPEPAPLMPPQHCECGRELPCFDHRAVPALQATGAPSLRHSCRQGIEPCAACADALRAGTTGEGETP